MLEFTFDNNVKIITAIKNCRLIYNLVGGGGGGGGSDRNGGSNGISGESVQGSILLNEGETIYCAVGSGGQKGQRQASQTRNGGVGGYSINGFSGGTGGSSGPYGSSGSGGGGGGATVLWKTSNSSRQYIAIAAGGGGGGGGGDHSQGYIRSYSAYGYAKDHIGLTDPSIFGRGGKGQDHQGDGGGAGGGGGGLYGGQGGTQPPGDLGAMSGSNGLSVRYTDESYILSRSLEFSLKGNGGSAGVGATLATDGQDGYASFLAIQSDLKININGQWINPLECRVYSNNSWIPVYEIYYRNNSQFIKTYGEITLAYNSVGDSINNITSPAVPYPPPPEPDPWWYNDGGGS